MFFSIIIPCFNSEKTILRTLESVKIQCFKDYELIIVDDGSIDLTAKVVNSFCKENNLKYKYIYQENAGPSAARNHAVANADGKFLAFLDADDTWHSSKLQIQYDKILELKANFITTEYTYNDFSSFDNETFKIDKYDFKSFLLSNKTSTPCTVVSKEIFDKYGGFPEDQRYSEDYNLWLNISYYEPLYKIHTPLVKLYKHPYGYTGLSANLLQMERYELINYLKLYKVNKINIFSLSILSVLSVIKFLRRMILVSFRTN